MENKKSILSTLVKQKGAGWPMVFVWAGLGIFLVFLALILYRTQRGAITIGEQIPDFSLQTFEGQTINFSSLRGKVVVVNFWASWCGPCAEEASWLEMTWQHYRSSDDVVILGVDYVDTEADALKYIQKYSISYPNGTDKGTRISQLFRIRGVPETYILDRDGTLVYYKIGPFSSYDEIINIIDPLLPNR